jgi:hypothetical protein
VGLRGSYPFDCDGGLHCVCDVNDPGFDSKYDRVWVELVRLRRAGGLRLSRHLPAPGHVGSMMANGGDGAVGKEVGFSVREIDSEEAERLNVHELDCENENEEEGGERLWVEDCLESVWGKKVGCKESLRAL